MSRSGYSKMTITYLREVSDSSLHWNARDCLTEALSLAGEEDQVIVLIRNPQTGDTERLCSGLRDTEAIGVLFEAARDW